MFFYVLHFSDRFAQGVSMPVRPAYRKFYRSPWPYLSYYIRFVRAKGRCEVCGVPHGSRHPVFGIRVILQTGHRNHIPWDNRLENLIAVCQVCHNRMDAGIRTIHRTRPKCQPPLPGLRPCPCCNVTAQLISEKCNYLYDGYQSYDCESHKRVSIPFMRVKFSNRRNPRKTQWIKGGNQ